MEPFSPGIADAGSTEDNSGKSKTSTPPPAVPKIVVQLGSHLHALLAPRRHVLLPLLGLAVLCQLAILWSNREQLRRSRAAWQLEIAGIASVALALTLAAHWLGFKFFAVLLPRERTAMYVVVLATLATGAVASVAAPLPASRISHKMLSGMLMVMAVYFLLCLRLRYFDEWKYGAEANRAYQVVSDYSQRLDEHNIPSHWFYESSLNFYRAASHNDRIGRFIHKDPRARYPEQKRLYVMYYPEDREFIEKNKLRIVYHGTISDIVVAMRPPAGAAVGPSAPEPIRDPLFWQRYHDALAASQR